MPGRDYTKAYALLEKSLHPSDSFGSLDGFKDLNGDRSWLAEPSPQLNAAASATIKLDGSDLPPTPPLNEHGFNPTSESRIGQDDLQKSSVSSLSTPTNPISPPTPDTTPPRLLEEIHRSRSTDEYLSPPMGAHSPASYPESYSTAIEDHNPVASTLRLDYINTEEEEEAEGGEFFDSTPTAKVPVRSTEFDAGYNGHEMEEIANRSSLKHEMDISDLYEAAIRAKSGVINTGGGVNSTKFRDAHVFEPSPQSPFEAQPTSAVSDTGSIPILMRGLSLKDTTMPSQNEPAILIPEAETTSATNDAWDIAQEPQSDNHEEEEERHIYGSPSPVSESRLYAEEFDEKRGSGTSGSSTIVEAVVIDSPPARKRKLRHANKNASLRDEASNSSGSNRNSINSSNDSPLHRLSRKQHHIQDQRNRDSLDSDFSPSLGSHSLRRRRDTIPGRPQTVPSNTSPTRYSNGVEPISGLHSLLPPQYFDRRAVSDPLRSKAPLAAAAKQATVSFRQSTSAMNLSDSDGDVPIGFIPPFADSHHTMFKYETNLTSRARAGGDISEETYQALRKSTDQSILTGQNTSKPSLADSQPSSSPHLVKVSPGSLEALEVNEATAVSIYPHNNNSVLVVQQAGGGGGSPVQVSTSSPMRIRALDPTGGIFIEPATPAADHGYHARDSPMENPRKPPEPPVVAVIPPTPARELDEQDVRVEESRATGQTLSRGNSLVQRARRYSDAVIVTLAGGSPGSLRRSGSRGRYSRHRPGYGSAVRSPSVSEPSQREGKLHPFWQPRTFWNDLSDSEDDEFEDYELEEDDRLPAGGDTRDVGVKGDMPRWRRGGSIRGFLIGNSLGLERGPTNKRRHVVTLPRQVSVRDSARRSGNEKRRRRDSSSWVQTLRQRIKERSSIRLEKRKQKQRQALRDSIGPHYLTPNTQEPSAI